MAARTVECMVQLSPFD